MILRALVFSCATLGAVPMLAAPVTAHIENATKPTSCAETDNVYVKFSGAGISHFTIEARHPPYFNAIVKDEDAPDFTDCDQSHDPSFKFDPIDVVLFQDDEYRLVGHRYPTNWRPERVDFQVGGTVTNGLHLIQLLRKIDGRWIELLVLYPSDGYWRMKPLTPTGMKETLYGSSFLIGPIVEDGRPYVPLSSIAFDRRTLSFQLAFHSGKGQVTVLESSIEHTVVSVDLPPGDGSRPWGALRSMFVSPAMADMTHVRQWLAGGDARVERILDFKAADVLTVSFDRPFPSHHNTSAPDTIFGNFKP